MHLIAFNFPYLRFHAHQQLNFFGFLNLDEARAFYTFITLIASSSLSSLELSHLYVLLKKAENELEFPVQFEIKNDSWKRLSEWNTSINGKEKKKLIKIIMKLFVTKL